MDAIKAAIAAFVESNFATSKFLELIEVIMSAIFGYVAKEEGYIAE